MVPISAWEGTRQDEVLHPGKSEMGMVNTEYKRYLARIPKTYAIVKLGYSADVYDIEPVLIQPAFNQCVSRLMMIL